MPDHATKATWTSESPVSDSNITAAYQTISLDGQWSVSTMPIDVHGEAGYKAFVTESHERLPAQVPGEIHLDLIRIGRMEDPSVSENARKRCRWPEQHAWWYRTEFTLPANFSGYQSQRLIFEGIDLCGEIFLNGKLLGLTQNAYAPAEFDLKNIIRDGSNELVVRVTSGMELIPKPIGPPPEVKLDPVYADRSFIFEKYRVLRKAAYSTYGWDWCDALPNIGIWRGVRVEGRSGVTIHHLRLDTFRRTSGIALEGAFTIDNLSSHSEIACTLELCLDPPPGKGNPIVRYHAVNAPVGRSIIPCQLDIVQPHLWWPNGMGEQPLYQLTARVLQNAKELDCVRQTIGLRTIELDRSLLPDGSRFCLRINGEKVYCKGANWAPADLIPARIDASRYQKLIAEAKNAHFTMLRVNGVGLYESEHFYDACDRAGILVWQDFAFSCALYPDRDQDFMARVRDEAVGLVKRLRHRPSVALWCGGNECQMTMAAWKFDASKQEDTGGARIYNGLLPDVCHNYDPGRPYWPGSPFGDGDPNSQISGDTHGLGKLGTAGPPDELTQHLVDQCRARFVSEYGIIGPPSLNSIREFLHPNEIAFGSDAWKTHTNMFDAMTGGYTVKGIEIHYGDAKNLTLSQFVLYGQMFQAQLQGRVMDATRFRKNDASDDCQGTLVWSYNDTWGETGWSILDHYLRRKASYYWFKRSAAPVKVLVRSRDGYLVTRVVNDTRRACEATVQCGWMRLDGVLSEHQEYHVSIPSNGMIEVSRTPMSPSADRDPRQWLYAATLSGAGIADDQAIWLFRPQRELMLAKPTISAKLRDGHLEVRSSVYCHGVHIDDGGSEILSDNYFDLLPGVSRRIAIATPQPSNHYAFAAVMPIA
jgi:beta-mannosidase